MEESSVDKCSQSRAVQISTLVTYIKRQQRYVREILYYNVVSVCVCVCVVP